MLNVLKKDNYVNESKVKDGKTNIDMHRVTLQK